MNPYTLAAALVALIAITGTYLAFLVGAGNLRDDFRRHHGSPR